MNVYFAEVVGTAILILLGNGVVANVVLARSKGQNGGWIVITLGWGLGVAFAVYAVGHISGAHINPAVTVGLASVGEFPWARVPGYIVAQIAGGAIGATLVWLTYLPHWAATEDPAAKLACYSTGPAIRKPWANMITEIVGTAMLVFGVLALGAISRGLENVMGVIDETTVQVSETATLQEGLVAGFSTWLGPLMVGVLVLSIGLSLGGPTGYAINPARDLGPRIAHALLPIAGKGSSDWRYAWVPIVGPLIGGVLGAWLIMLLGLTDR